MKAYALDLRERVVKFVNDGGSKVEAARRFELARSSVYRYLDAVEAGTLAPKASWGHWRKLDPQKLQSHVKKHPGATLRSASMFIFCRCSCANFFPDGRRRVQRRRGGASSRNWGGDICGRLPPKLRRWPSPGTPIFKRRGIWQRDEKKFMPLYIRWMNQ